MGRRPVIALVSDSILPYHRGGKEQRYHEVGRRLARRAEVHVFTMRWWDTPNPRVEDGVTFHAICPRIPLYEGERRSTRQAVLFALACLRLLTRRFDVIEADHMPYLHLFTLRLVATLRRRRFVVTWHEVWGPAYWRRYLGRRGRIAWWIERAAMRLPDEIIAASEETGRRLRRRLGSATPVTVAPNGIDLPVVRASAVANEPTTLVAVGRLLSHKRVDLLLDAVALLRADGGDVTCRVIGDGPEREALHAHAGALGIADAVDFRHDVEDQTDLYGLVKAARVFVFPSEREGFGIAALEALACGLPVVTTRAPDNLAAHLVRDSGRGVVCEPTAEALADAVTEALRRPETEARPAVLDAWLQRSDWDRVSERVLAVALRGRRWVPAARRREGPVASIRRRAMSAPTILAGGGIVLAAGALGLAQTGPGRDMLTGSGLTVRPQAYTEVAFEPPLRLPSLSLNASTPLRVRFRVGNHEDGPVDYRWSVFLDGTADRTRLATGSLSLPQGSERQVTELVTATCTSPGRARIRVDVAPPRQRLALWTECR